MTDGTFSKKLKYHVLVVSKKNSGKLIDADHVNVNKDFKNVSLYVLSDGVHPNNYKYSISETINNIHIIEKEFNRLLSYINK